MKDGRRHKGAVTRSLILGATLELLGERGLAGVTARAVAERAGVSQGNLFHHFRSVDDLLLEAGMQLIDGMAAEVRARGHARLEEYLSAMGSSIIALAREHPETARAFFALYAKCLFDEPMRRKIAAYYQDYLEGLKSDLAPFFPGGNAHPALARTALTLCMLLDGIAYHWTIFNDLEALETYWNAMARSLARLVAMEEGG